MADTSLAADKKNAVNWIFRVGADSTFKTLDLKTDVANLLAETGTGEYFWLDLNYDHKSTDNLLIDLGVNEEARDALLTNESRPKSTQIDDAWLLNLRAINKNPENHPEHMISLRLWITPNLLITLRRSNWPLYSTRDLKLLIEQGRAPETSLFAALQLAEYLTLRVRDSVDQLEDVIANLELESFNGRFGPLRNQLSLKRREAAGLRRFLGPQREALEGLVRHRDSVPEDATYWVRDLIEKTTRYMEDLDLVREKATVLQEDMRATVGEQQNQRMYVLSIVTAVFLPLSFLTGVFGMNVAGLPGTESGSAFWLLATCMVALAGGIAWLMRKQGWF